MRGRRRQSRTRREIDEPIALVVLGEYLEQRHRAQQRLHRAVVLARDGVDTRRRAGGSAGCARHGDRILDMEPTRAPHSMRGRVTVTTPPASACSPHKARPLRHEGQHLRQARARFPRACHVCPCFQLGSRRLQIVERLSHYGDAREQLVRDMDTAYAVPTRSPQSMRCQATSATARIIGNAASRAAS